VRPRTCRSARSDHRPPVNNYSTASFFLLTEILKVIQTVKEIIKLRDSQTNEDRAASEVYREISNLANHHG
jgi:hypothetical protein